MYDFYPPILLSGEQVTFSVDLTQVKHNDDGSVVVGDPNSSVCFNGDFLIELLTKKSDD